MSEKQNQTSDSLSQLPGLAEIMSSIINYDDYMFNLNKKPNKKEQQKQTYYKVLHAFRAESPSISTPRILIIQDLKKALDIPDKTHSAIEKKLEDDPLVKRRRNASKASDNKEEQKATAVEGHPVNKEDLLELQERLNAAPATMQRVNTKSSSSSEDPFVPSWGQVSPQSLVGRWVNIRMLGEDEYVAFHIKGYNEETEMHHLVTTKSQRTHIDPLDWIDIRHIPAGDIAWQDGQPGIPARKCSLKPGETILCTTSTSQDKKQIIEVGKSASGIPIIRKSNKGKAIALA